MNGIEIKEVIKIVEEAGGISLNFYKKGFFVKKKKDKTLVTEADHAVNDFLIEELAKFNFPILSEEGGFSGENKSDSYRWIIDPIDGTTDFINKTGEFSIMVGLANNETGKSVLGVVYAPFLGELYFAQKNKGAFLIKKGEKFRLSVSSREIQNGRILVSRHHLGAYEQEVARKYEMLQIPMGSAGLKICRIAKGEAELYVNSGNKSSLWDICAGEVILEEAGGRIRTFEDQKIDYSNSEERLLFGYKVLNQKDIINL